MPDGIKDIDGSFASSLMFNLCIQSSSLTGRSSREISAIKKMRSFISFLLVSLAAGSSSPSRYSVGSGCRFSVLLQPSDVLPEYGEVDTEILDSITVSTESVEDIANNDDEGIDEIPNFGQNSAKKSLIDRWFPPFWDPNGSVAAKNSKNATFSDEQKKDGNFHSSTRKKKKQNKADNEEKQNEKKDDGRDEIDRENDTEKDGKEELEQNSANNTKSDEGATKTDRKTNDKKDPPESVPMQLPRQGTGVQVPMSNPSGRVLMPQQMTPQQQQYQQIQMRRTATSLAAAEILVTLLGNSLRLWFLLWASRHFANRQESVHPTQHFVFEHLNDYFVRDKRALETALWEPPQGITRTRWKRIMSKRSRKEPLFKIPNLDQTFVRTAIVLDFGNDSKGNLDLKYLADVITFLLTQHRSQAFGSLEQKSRSNDIDPKPVELEVIINLNSPGGSVSAFGLAAAQIERLRRESGITTTVCVDKVAASGGYMIASQADQLFAAPFATVGSIGVIMETLNFHDILRQYGVQPVVVKAGDAKNPLTTYGPVTKRDLEEERVRLDKVHKEFQKYTIRGRPQLTGTEADLCNGSIYIGREALSLHLVDAIMTSDEYLMERIEAGDRVLKIQRSTQSRIPSHARFPSPIDVLPHLWKNRVVPFIEEFVSEPQMINKVIKAGSFLGLVHHFITSHFRSLPKP